MKTFSVISLLVMLTLPAGTFAFVDVDSIVEAAKAGNGTYVESHSSASTGGQHAASGQSVTTGDVSASSHTETRINANGDGGTVEVKVETTKNGETETKEYSESIEPNAGVQVEVNASATNDETMSEVRVDGEVVGETGESNTSSITADVNAFFTASVPNFFKKVISFFWRF